MRRYHETFRLWEYLLFALVTLAVLCQDRKSVV